MASAKWTHERVKEIFELPFIDLIYKAQTTHRENFSPNEVELCTLLSIKTGACPEDCAYCPQSGHYQTGTEREKLLNKEEILSAAKAAKENGAVRFCMGAAWRNPPKKDFPKVLDIIRSVKELGLETCVTLGTLDEEQAQSLAEIGLDFYNHNIDTSPEFYKKIISTHTFEDRINTLNHVRNAGIHVCCGGIMGMGETREDRIEFLLQLGNLPKAPESIPINRLLPIKGTPLENATKIDNTEFIRTIATARIMMPTSIIRLSAGRVDMSEEMQILCFTAGANSIWLGDKLLVTKNPDSDEDYNMLKKLGIIGTKVFKAHDKHAN